MPEEFTRQPGNVATSNQGFTVTVNGASEVNVVYEEAGQRTQIPAERTMSGIGLFMNWAEFPNPATPEQQRLIFERVVRAIWFMGIKIEGTEITNSFEWPLPKRT